MIHSLHESRTCLHHFQAPVHLPALTNMCCGSQVCTHTAASRTSQRLEASLMWPGLARAIALALNRQKGAQRNVLILWSCCTGASYTGMLRCEA